MIRSLLQKHSLSIQSFMVTVHSYISTALRWIICNNCCILGIMKPKIWDSVPTHFVVFLKEYVAQMIAWLFSLRLLFLICFDLCSLRGDTQEALHNSLLLWLFTFQFATEGAICGNKWSNYTSFIKQNKYSPDPDSQNETINLKNQSIGRHLRGASSGIFYKLITLKWLSIAGRVWKRPLSSIKGCLQVCC